MLTCRLSQKCPPPPPPPHAIFRGIATVAFVKVIFILDDITILYRLNLLIFDHLPESPNAQSIF